MSVMWLAKLPAKKQYLGSLHAYEAGRERHFKRHSTERSLTNKKTTYCIWINRNKKPSEKIINAQLLAGHSCLAYMVQGVEP
jgi:hypothetical protein